MTRCETCDRPIATDEQWESDDWGTCTDLCWGEEQCHSARVDWRARAMELTGERDHWREIAGFANGNGALAAEVIEAHKRDIAAARERIGELERAMDADSESRDLLMARQERATREALSVVRDQNEELRAKLSGAHDTVAHLGRAIDDLACEIQRERAARERLEAFVRDFVQCTENARQPSLVRDLRDLAKRARKALGEP